MYYILASHGSYAEEALKSSEMITGETTLYKTVAFDESMGDKDLVNQYEDIISADKDSQCLGIITDLYGGTPFNAARKVASDYPTLSVVSGLSLALLVSLSTGRSLEEAVLDSKENSKLVESDGQEAFQPSDALKEKPSEPKDKNGIVNVRLDERLIHGQVATFWSRSLNIDRIMIVDDEVIHNEVDKMALKTAVPNGIRLSILSTDTASKRLNDGLYSNQRVMVIFRHPAVIKKLLEKGVHIKEINIGNMSQKEDRIKLKKSVYATNEEIKNILSLEKQDLRIYAQMVPSEEKKEFKKFVSK